MIPLNLILGAKPSKKKLIKELILVRMTWWKLIALGFFRRSQRGIRHYTDVPALAETFWLLTLVQAKVNQYTVAGRRMVSAAPPHAPPKPGASEWAVGVAMFLLPLGFAASPPDFPVAICNTAVSAVEQQLISSSRFTRNFNWVILPVECMTLHSGMQRWAGIIHTLHSLVHVVSRLLEGLMHTAVC